MPDRKPAQCRPPLSPTSCCMITWRRVDNGSRPVQNLRNVAEPSTHGRNATKKLCTWGAIRSVRVSPQKSTGWSAIASKMTSYGVTGT